MVKQTPLIQRLTHTHTHTHTHKLQEGPATTSAPSAPV